MIRQLIVLLAFAVFDICAFGMDVETDRMKIRVGGQYPELYYDQISDCKFEIRSWRDGWYVVAGSERGGCCIAPGNVGDSVWDELFQNKQISHDSGPGVTIFRIAFHYWFNEQNGVRRDYYGWVSLVTDANGQPAVLASEVSELHALPIVGRGEPSAPPEEPEEPAGPLTFKVINHGDWAELAPRCVPEGTKGRIEIPTEIDAKPVLAIGEDAFYGRTGITDVSYSWMVGSIGYKSFCSCSALWRVIIPETVTNVDACAFSFSGIGEVDIGGGVRVIREETFYGCQSLSNAVLRAGVEVICTNAFGGCLSLKSVTIPQTVERIESGAFEWTGLNTVQVPYTTIIEEGAFDSSTKVVRYGPDISSDVTLRECEKPTLMRLLGVKTLRNARTVSVRPEFDKEKEEEPQEPLDAARVCVQLGITPVRVESDAKGVCVDAYFRVPKIQIVKFDPVARTVKGRVIPAEGSRIAEPPQEYVFVLYYHYPNGSGSFGIKEVYCPFTEWNYALLDLSDYIKTGEFTFTYTEDLNQCDTVGLFSVGISNDYYWSWESSTLVDTQK